jgi:hypothetical protein
MLSVSQCRKIVGPSCNLSDSDLELLRDQLNGLADISNAIYRQKGFMPVSASTKTEKLTNAESERAAIMEFDAGLPRSEAEAQAFHHSRKRE